jgi:His-Xaa-Ser system radical SAM maturase HxsB
MRPPAPPKLDEAKTGFFRVRRIGGRVLLTNDIGHYALLTEAEFSRFVRGGLKPKERLHRALSEQGFMREHTDFDRLVEEWKKRNRFLWQGPSLHIVVVTLRCDHKCVYCQTSSVGMGQRGFDMSEQTARRVVDTIFDSPSRSLTIEFQGGEPLANWPVVRFIVEYSLEKNKEKKKSLWLNLVTNLSLMDRKKLDFLLGHGVNVCTSLDGPRELHDANRIVLGGGSYATVLRRFKQIKKRTKNKVFGIDALMTTTRRSLGYPEEIVNAYVRLGALGVYLRPLSRFGFAKKTWDAIGYTADEFLDFYRKALDRILQVNLKGRVFFEQTARILATKMLKKEDPNFLDLRSPCGAGIGQVAYNYDGRVFTCDEGRMLSRMGDDAFCIGDVSKDGYGDIVNHPTVRALATASCLETQAECSGCAYYPYCGTCPVENFAVQSDLFCRAPLSERCRLYKGILDILFLKMRKASIRDLILSWTRTPQSLYQRE